MPIESLEGSLKLYRQAEWVESPLRFAPALLGHVAAWDVVVVSPMLEQASGFGRDAPVVGIAQFSPLADLTANLIHHRRDVVLLLLRRQPLALVKDELLLILGSPPLLGLWNRRDELRAAPVLDDLLGGLALIIKLPVLRRVLVRGVEYGLFEEAIHHELPHRLHCDTPALPGLLDTTARRFRMAEVSADKAYLSEGNLRHIEAHGADPYIPFKSNTTGQGSPMWKRLYAYFTLNEDAWKGHYHKRSNVETAFSMIKGKFGDAVRAKSESGQTNEILLKCLCHNICVLIHAMHELEIGPLHLGRN